MSKTIQEMLASLTERQQQIYDLMLAECGYEDGGETTADGSYHNDLAHERAAAAMWVLRRVMTHTLPEQVLPSGGFLPGDRVLIGPWPGTVQDRLDLVPVKLDAVPRRAGEFPAWIVKELDG